MFLRLLQSGVKVSFPCDLRHRNTSLCRKGLPNKTLGVYFDIPSNAGAILQDDLVNDLSAKDAPPPPKKLTDTVELLVDHYASTSITSHGSLL